MRNLIERDANIVEGLLLEPVVLREHRGHSGREDWHEGRNEVREADQVVFVLIEELGVGCAAGPNVLAVEEELTAGEKN